LESDCVITDQDYQSSPTLWPSLCVQNYYWSVLLSYTHHQCYLCVVSWSVWSISK